MSCFADQLTDDAIFLRWEHNKWYTWWGLVGASFRWADWPAVVAPSPSQRRLLWLYEVENANSWKTRNPAAPKTHPLENALFWFWKLSMDIQGCSNTKRRHVRHAECATHRAATHLPTGIEGVRTHASTSLLRVSAGVLCLASNGDWSSRSLEKFLKLESPRIRSSWAVSYFTDQLTP